MICGSGIFPGRAVCLCVVFEPGISVEATHRFVDALKLFGIGASWGGYESLALPTTGFVTRSGGEIRIFWRGDGAVSYWVGGCGRFDCGPRCRNAGALRLKFGGVVWAGGLQATHPTALMARRVSAAVAVLVVAGCYAEPTLVRKVPDPVPQCALPQPVAQRSYIVFFDRHSDVISDRGAAILREFVNFLKPFGNLKIRILANTDASETLQRDHGLDVRRGQAVARMIRDIGIPRDSSIDVEGYGSRAPLLPTPPGVAEPQNRYVTLIVWMGAADNALSLPGSLYAVVANS